MYDMEQQTYIRACGGNPPTRLGIIDNPPSPEGMLSRDELRLRGWSHKDIRTFGDKAIQRVLQNKIYRHYYLLSDIEDIEDGSEYLRQKIAVLEGAVPHTGKYFLRDQVFSTLELTDERFWTRREIGITLGTPDAMYLDSGLHYDTHFYDKSRVLEVEKSNKKLSRMRSSRRRKHNEYVASLIERTGKPVIVRHADMRCVKGIDFPSNEEMDAVDLKGKNVRVMAGDVRLRATGGLKIAPLIPLSTDWR